MKSIISTTYDNNYLYFLPITTFCWNKLGADVVCFMPYGGSDKFEVVLDYMPMQKISPSFTLEFFDAPEHKQATYAQCARLFGGCLNCSDEEVLISSDIDMALFKLPLPMVADGQMTIHGADLVPPNQYPMCYASASAKEWRRIFQTDGKTYQQCLDQLVGVIECEHFRGNQWSLDQHTLFHEIENQGGCHKVNRAKEGTQFASNRLDRDDAYILDRLNLDIVDYHMNRPGYTEENFKIILAVLQYFYPNENFDWLVEYTIKYRELI